MPAGGPILSRAFTGIVCRRAVLSCSGHSQASCAGGRSYLVPGIHRHRVPAGGPILSRAFTGIVCRRAVLSCPGHSQASCAGGQSYLVPGIHRHRVLHCRRPSVDPGDACLHDSTLILTEVPHITDNRCH